jgi:hypothetical protein
MAGTRWARLDYPSTFRMTPEDMARLCGWRLKRRGADIEICLAEAYEGRAFSGLEVVTIADRRTHADPARYTAFDRLRTQDEYIGGGRVRARVLSLPEVANPSDPQDPWVALRLLYLTTPDRDLAGFVKQQFDGVLDADPDARLFLVRAARHARCSRPSSPQETGCPIRIDCPCFLRRRRSCGPNFRGCPSTYRRPA